MAAAMARRAESGPVAAVADAAGKVVLLMTSVPKDNAQVRASARRPLLGEPPLLSSDCVQCRREREGKGERERESGWDSN